MDEEPFGSAIRQEVVTSNTQIQLQTSPATALVLPQRESGIVLEYIKTHTANSQNSSLIDKVSPPPILPPNNQNVVVRGTFKQNDATKNASLSEIENVNPEDFENFASSPLHKPNLDVMMSDIFGDVDDNEESENEMDYYHDEEFLRALMNTAGPEHLGEAQKSQVPNNGFYLPRMNLGEKAGMGSVDKEKVNRIIEEMSRNSNFYLNERKKNERTERHIQALLALKEEMGAPTLEQIASVNRIVESLEAKYDMSQLWLHVDMDAFFAAVEIRDNPALAGLPIAVGSMHMISTSSYEARKYGVRAAMPGFIALKLCPDLKLVQPRHEKYVEISKLIRNQIFPKYDINFEMFSVDEAALNITNYLSSHPELSWVDVVERIQSEMMSLTQLTCSIGVAHSRTLAKVACDINKPNGHYFIPSNRQDALNFLNSLPIRKISGIGRVTEQVLVALGVQTVKDLFDKRYDLFPLFSERTFKWFMKRALGVGGEHHSARTARKSVGRSRTFGNEHSPPILFDHLYRISKMVASDLKKLNMRGKCLTLSTKSSKFEFKSRAKTLPTFISTAEDIFEAAKALLHLQLPGVFRLLGVRITKLSSWEEETTEKVLTHFFQPIPKVEYLKSLEQDHSKHLASNSNPKSPSRDTLDDHFSRSSGPNRVTREPKPSSSKTISMYYSHNKRSRGESIDQTHTRHIEVIELDDSDSNDQLEVSCSSEDKKLFNSKQSRKRPFQDAPTDTPSKKGRIQ